MPRKQAYAKGYGSNWKKYLIWYIIAAIIVYGLIWYFFLRGSVY